MELVYTYVNKHASASYHTCADEPVKSQFETLLSRCKEHNSKLHNKLTKKVNKEKLANEIAVLLRIKGIAEQQGEYWSRDRKELNTWRGVQSADAPRAARENASTLTVQDKYHLCQILGEFNGLESPVSISNKLEAVVCQYGLNNKDACALLKAWLPGPLTAQISMNNDQLVGAEGRRKELQRVLGSRDRRGTQDLSRMKFRRGDDPIIFFNEYLSLYRVVYNCPDISSDDMEFLYSMIALRNASSYQQFINILRDWCEQDKERAFEGSC
ncbi:posterior protein-like [Pyxicephalus adspersus]|uniref:posterior protein-like n=1 Tax=Pyxicephalus adspersus TaxID=30357 RepID=UPI003B5A0167